MIKTQLGLCFTCKRHCPVFWVHWTLIPRVPVTVCPECFNLGREIMAPLDELPRRMLQQQSVN